MFDNVHEKNDTSINEDGSSPNPPASSPESCVWDHETSKAAADCLVDLFLCFFNVLRPLLPNVVSILAGYIKSPNQALGKSGVSALGYLTDELGSQLLEDDWRGILLALKEAAVSTLPGFLKVLRMMDNIELPNSEQSYNDLETSSGEDVTTDLEEADLQTASHVFKRMKSHISVQLVVIQVSLFLFFPSSLECT